MDIYSSKNRPPGFYVYAYLREDGTPYYIGKGKNRRAWSTQRTVIRPKNIKNIIILYHSLTESESFELEKKYILKYGRKDIGTGILRNLSDGGDGASGRNLTPEFGKKISKTKRTKSKRFNFIHTNGTIEYNICLLEMVEKYPHHNLDRDKLQRAVGCGTRGYKKHRGWRILTKEPEVFVANKSSYSGLQGIYFYKANKKWIAAYCKNNKRTHLGYYLSKEEAIKALNEYKLKNNLI
jgi:hypothetical protein